MPDLYNVQRKKSQTELARAPWGQMKNNTLKQNKKGSLEIGVTKMTDKQIAITIIPMVSGTLSILASTTIIIKVLQSRTKLSTPYNRLLIGLCVFDIIASVCQAFSTLPVPKDQPGYQVALGNDTTCKVQGTLAVFSTVSTPLYNLALCGYFLCVIKYNMTDKRFERLWEPYLHALPILYRIGIIHIHWPQGISIHPTSCAGSALHPRIHLSPTTPLLE